MKTVAEFAAREPHMDAMAEATIAAMTANDFERSEMVIVLGKAMALVLVMDGQSLETRRERLQLLVNNIDMEAEFKLKLASEVIARVPDSVS